MGVFRNLLKVCGIAKDDEPRISLSLNPVNVFRALEANIIFKDKGFVESLNIKFDEFLRSVPQASGLGGWEEYRQKTKEDVNKDAHCRTMNEHELYKCFMHVENDAYIGTVLNYKIKLNGGKEGEEADLISYNPNEKIIYVIELKRMKARENPLRALLETLTCWLEMLDADLREKQLKRGECLKGNATAFIKKCPDFTQKDSPFYIANPNDVCLKPAILLYGDSDDKKDSKTYKDLCASPEEPYRELYEKIFRYVKCFSYAGKTPESLKIKSFRPQDEWGKGEAKATASPTPIPATLLSCHVRKRSDCQGSASPRPP